MLVLGGLYWLFGTSTGTDQHVGIECTLTLPTLSGAPPANIPAPAGTDRLIPTGMATPSGMLVSTDAVWRAGAVADMLEPGGMPARRHRRCGNTVRHLLVPTGMLAF